MIATNFTIIGSGAYGTCLANVLADNHHEVIIYGIDQGQIDDIAIHHKNREFFGEIKLNNKIKATTNLAAALEKTDILILAVPTSVLSSVLDQIIIVADRPLIVVNTAKGLNPKNNDLFSNTIIKKLGKAKILSHFGVIYGPSIASEVIKRLPTGVTLGMSEKMVADDLKSLFQNEYFAVETTNDIPGCEIYAALKNGIAIGAGILDGLQAGDNARAVLIIKGSQEIFKISSIFNGKIQTGFSYAGGGDLILTATSPKSRNYDLGFRLATATNIEKILHNNKLTVEGVAAIKIAHALSTKHNLKTPIFTNLYEILYNFKRPITLVNNFLKSEN